MKLPAPSSSSAGSDPTTVPSFGKNTGGIPAWLKHVQATHALPSLSVTTEEGVVTPEVNSSLSTPLNYYRLSIPRTDVKGLILRRLSKAMGNREIPETLQSFACPETRPLVGGLKHSRITDNSPFNFQSRSLIPDPSAVEVEYNRTLNLRDLFWVQQLMMEMRLGRHLSQYISSKHLSDVRRVVAQAEKAALYVVEFSSAQGWDLNFSEMDKRRRAALSRSHPIFLIQPYIQADMMPFTFEDSDLSTSDTSDTDDD